MYARLRCGGNLPLCVRGLGTRNTLLRYEVQFAPLLRYGVQFIIQRRAAPEITFWCME